MYRGTFSRFAAVVYSGIVALSADAQAQLDVEAISSELSEITVRAKRVANTQPAGSYAAVATALRFDPLTELQARGLAEGQADVTVRGGLFENTGFKVGAVTVMDPQTGHYSAGLPLSTAVLSSPRILVGLDNALHGFNSSIATVTYDIPGIDENGRAAFGSGSDHLVLQSLRIAGTRETIGEATVAAAVSAASSQADGSLPNGDHNFKRYNLHGQRITADAQTDAILAYQDLFYGWPGAYTGFAQLAETDHTKTRLILLNHREQLDDGWFELTAVHRQLEDDYDFDRSTSEAEAPGAFDHETRMSAVGLQGVYQAERIAWRYSGQVTADKLVRSTDLTQGDYASRRYLKMALVPLIDLLRSDERTLSLRMGATFDASDRDGHSMAPLLGVSIRATDGDGEYSADIEYAGASQLPGYTALKSRPAGLFGGNRDLGREKSRQWSLSFARKTLAWDGRVTLFQRSDNDLVDWTYRKDAPFARQANPVDLDVVGAEASFSRRWTDLDLLAAYTWLDKDAEYGPALVDGSYYALNYARHRVTVAAVWTWNDVLQWRLDNEFRAQQDNPLRNGGEQAWLVSLGLEWESRQVDGLGFTLTADNLTDSDYEAFPGTPAVGRQFSFLVRYDW